MIFLVEYADAQGCCSGGSGSPIAGGNSQGVLREKQIEFAGNFNYLNSRKFYVEDRDTSKLLQELNSKYLFFRAGYGLTKKLTLELGYGHYLQKQIIDLPDMVGEKKKITHKGSGDLLIFPRYDIYFKSEANKKTEITAGIGVKIPIGSDSDSTLVFTNPVNGDEYFAISPPTVQATNGSQDFIFYLFALRGYNKQKFSVFANAMYIRKGYNSLGQKFGNYTTLSLFASKTLFSKLGLSAQLKGEWIGQMQEARNIDMVAFYNIDPASTGSKKYFFIPQLSFSHKSITIYALGEFPIYQYVNGNQIGSDKNITAGVSYRLNQFCN